MKDNENNNNKENASGKNENYRGADLNYIFGSGEKKKEEKQFSSYDENRPFYGGENTKFENQSDDRFYRRPESAYKGGGNFVKVFISIFVAIMMFTAGFLVAYTAMPSEEEKLVRWIKSEADKYFYDVDGSGYNFIKSIGDSMTGSLDQYSRFYFGEGLDKLRDENSGVFNDTGMVLAKPKDEQFVRVLKVYGNSPAYIAGLRIGDVLSKINEDDVKGENYEEIRARIREHQSKGETITYTFTRHLLGDVTSTKTFVHKAEEYKPVFSYYYDSDSVEMNNTGIDNDTAYISFEEFTAGAEAQFAQNLNIFKQKGKKNLILDLRVNFGGSLDVLQKMASHLVTDEAGSQNVRIMYAELKDKTRIAYSTESNKYSDYGFENIIVLADGFSASATEVLISAMKDYGTMTKLIGSTTYGKAVMQSYRDYKGIYGIYLTVALLYAPVNTNFTYNNKGFTPDLAVTYNLAGEFAADNTFMQAINSLSSPI